MFTPSKKQVVFGIAASVLAAILVYVSIYNKQSAIHDQKTHTSLAQLPNESKSAQNVSTASVDNGVGKNTNTEEIIKVSQSINTLLEKWAKDSAGARLALDLNNLYNLWTLNAGAAQKRDVNAIQYLSSRDLEESRLHLSHAVYYLEFSEMLEDVKLQPLIQSAIENNSQFANDHQTRWNNPSVFDLDGFLPKQVLEDIQMNHTNPVVKTEWMNEFTKYASDFPESFVSWYRDAIRASIYTYLSSNFIRNNSPPELRKEQMRLQQLRSHQNK